MIYLLVATWLASCSQNYDITEELSEALPGNANVSASDYNVSQDDIAKLLTLNYGIIPTKANPLSIQPIINANDTVAYIVNLEEGWKIISADKRFPAVLAFNETGRFEPDSLNIGQQLWYENVGNQISTIKDSDIQENIDASWAGVSTYSRPDTVQTERPKPPYQVTKTLISDSVYFIPHLMKTQWGQGEAGYTIDKRLTYWNECTPYTKDYTKHCLAGCVAVAGAQMFYYLHENIGVPSTMFSIGYCNGYSHSDKDHNYYFNFSNPSTTIWNEMALDRYSTVEAQKKAAILIGWVGYGVNMDYGENSSGATTKDLVGLFNNNGISCSYKDYDEKSVVNSLMNKMPVIVRAYSNKRNRFLGWVYTYSGGHAWVIDGIYIQRRKFRLISTPTPGVEPHFPPTENLLSTNHKSFSVPEIGPPRPLPPSEIVVETSTYILMNWGWDGRDENVKYSLSPGWMGGNNNYRYKVETIIDFTKK